MTVITHWVAYDVNRPSAPHIAVTDPKRMEDYRAIGYTIEGPFVHKDQLTGAVARLDAIRSYLPQITDLRDADAIRALLDVDLTIPGGQ